MPFVKAETVTAVLNEATRTGRIVSPRFGGRHGHPVAFPGILKAEILKADVASTLATVLQAHDAQRTSIEVSDPGIQRDVDARADLASIEPPKRRT
jgi:CTP:molybdopterin cytidylyltransferase MocA